MTQRPSTSATHVPIRTCAGCRSRDEQSRLLRVAQVGGAVELDARRRRPGRGTYVHRRMSCVERALRPGGLGRALRTEISPDQMASLRLEVEQSINE